jgi:hypothetical protein
MEAKAAQDEGNTVAQGDGDRDVAVLGEGGDAASGARSCRRREDLIDRSSDVRQRRGRHPSRKGE